MKWQVTPGMSTNEKKSKIYKLFSFVHQKEIYSVVALLNKLLKGTQGFKKLVYVA